MTAMHNQCKRQMFLKTISLKQISNSRETWNDQWDGNEQDIHEYVKEWLALFVKYMKRG